MSDFGQQARGRGFRTDTSTVEELYFHTGNSGITARILEKKKAATTWAPDELVDHVTYRMEFVHGAHGHSSTMSTPILSPTMVQHYIDMLQRLKLRMEMEPGYSPERNFKEDRIVQIMNGYKIDPVYSPEIVTSRNGTSVFLLGHTYSKDGEEPIFKPYTGDAEVIGECGEAACGEPRFKPEHIGRPYAEAMREIDPDRNVRTRRIFYVDVGDVTKDKVNAILEQIKATVKRDYPRNG